MLDYRCVEIVRCAKSAVDGLTGGHGYQPLSPHDVDAHGRVTTLPAWKSWAKAATAKLDTMIDGAHAPQPTTPLQA